MTLVRVADGTALAARAAQLIGAKLDHALANGTTVHLALAGGQTPANVYELLAPASWNGVELWFGDERCVGPDDPQSNHAMVARTLLAHTGDAPVHRIEGELGAEAAASAYEAELRARVPQIDGACVLDLLLLGIGEDGHTASLFPGNPALDAHGVACVPVHDAPKPPPDRVSLSLGTLRAAREIVLLASGASKAVPLAAVLSGPHSTIPASLLPAERLTVIADEAALSAT